MGHTQAALLRRADGPDWLVFGVAHRDKKTYIPTSEGANGYEHRNRTWMGSAW
jgi:hypothetical protein